MVTKGQKVEQGTHILSIESMKTENHITAPATGIVDEILIQSNTLVKENQLLVSFKN
jgi:biotin carboxyl carrier protein